MFTMLYNYFCVQVYNCLQPFMICMSSLVTSHVIDNIANDYDAAVLAWKDELSCHVQATDGFEFYVDQLHALLCR